MNNFTRTGLAFLLVFTTMYSAHAQDIQRVRLDFETTDGCFRQLLLGFTPNNAATDNFDYGYDGRAPDLLPNDLNWIIEDERYVIQGVGAFEDTKVYPLGLFAAVPGTFKIELNSLENFSEEIDVFIYDSAEESYNRINDAFFEKETEIGSFQGRYYIAFKQPSLSTDEVMEYDFTIKYLRNSNELFINPSMMNDIKNVTIYNVLGQRIFNELKLKSNRFNLDLNSNKSNVYIVHLKTSKGIISKKIII